MDNITFETAVQSYPQLLGLFAISSAVTSHLLSRAHLGVNRSWIANKWFWAGLFGNLPALVGVIAHIFLVTRKNS